MEDLVDPHATAYQSASRSFSTQKVIKPEESAKVGKYSVSSEQGGGDARCVTKDQNVFDFYAEPVECRMVHWQQSASSGVLKDKQFRGAVFLKDHTSDLFGIAFNASRRELSRFGRHEVVPGTSQGG